MAKYTIQRGGLTFTRDTKNVYIQSGQSSVYRTTPSGYRTIKEKVFDVEAYQSFAKKKKSEAEQKKEAAEKRIKEFEKSRKQKLSKEELAERKELIGKERVTVKQPTRLTQARKAPVVVKFEADVAGRRSVARSDISKKQRDEYLSYNKEVEKINAQLASYKPTKEVTREVSSYVYYEFRKKKIEKKAITYASGQSYDAQVKAAQIGLQDYSTLTISDASGKVIQQGKSVPVSLTAGTNFEARQRGLAQYPELAGLPGFIPSYDIKITSSKIEKAKIEQPTRAEQVLQPGNLLIQQTQQIAKRTTFKETTPEKERVLNIFERGALNAENLGARISKNLPGKKVVGIETDFFTVGIKKPAAKTAVEFGVGFFAEPFQLAGFATRFATEEKLRSDIGTGITKTIQEGKVPEALGEIGSSVVRSFEASPGRFIGGLVSTELLFAGTGKIIGKTKTIGTKGFAKIGRRPVFKLEQLTTPKIAKEFVEQGKAQFLVSGLPEEKLLQRSIVGREATALKKGFGIVDDKAVLFTAERAAPTGLIGRLRGKSIVSLEKSVSEPFGKFGATRLVTGPFKGLVSGQRKITLLPRFGGPEVTATIGTAAKFPSSFKGITAQIKALGFDVGKLPKAGQEYFEGALKAGARPPKLRELRNIVGSRAVAASEVPAKVKGVITSSPQRLAKITKEEELIISFGTESAFKRGTGILGKIGPEGFVDVGGRLIPLRVQTIVSKPTVSAVRKSTSFFDDVTSFAAKVSKPSRDLTPTRFFATTPEFLAASTFGLTRPRTKGKVSVPIILRPSSKTTATFSFPYPTPSTTSISTTSTIIPSTPPTSTTSTIIPSTPPSTITLINISSIIPKLSTPPPSRISTIIPIIPPPIKKRKEEVSFVSERPVGSYHAFVRRNKNTKWVKVTQSPLPYNAAFNKGLFVADNTLGRSVKLKRVSTQPSGFDDPFINDAKFRKRKRKSKIPGEETIFVEKSKFALDTLGEKQGLKASQYNKRSWMF